MTPKVVDNKKIAIQVKRLNDTAARSDRRVEQRGKNKTKN